MQQQWTLTHPSTSQLWPGWKWGCCKAFSTFVAASWPTQQSTAGWSRTRSLRSTRTPPSPTWVDGGASRRRVSQNPSPSTSAWGQSAANALGCVDLRWRTMRAISRDCPQGGARVAYGWLRNSEQDNAGEYYTALSTLPHELWHHNQYQFPPTPFIVAHNQTRRIGQVGPTNNRNIRENTREESVLPEGIIVRWFVFTSSGDLWRNFDNFLGRLMSCDRQSSSKLDRREGWCRIGGRVEERALQCSLLVASYETPGNPTWTEPSENLPS